MLQDLTSPSGAVPRTQPGSRFIDVFLRMLEAQGVRCVFGIPGGLLHPFFEALDAHPRLRLVMSKHEEGAAFMADGYARVGGGLAVSAGTCGPGATNLLTGVACAFADGVPMLVVTGQAASAALGKGAAQETPREGIDVVAMFQPVTKYSAMVTSVDGMPHHLRRALRLALSGRPGPVHLNVPVELWEKPLAESWIEPASYRAMTRVFDPGAVELAAERLAAARRPVILAGSGVRTAGAEGALLALAELLPARVASTPRAKSVFPEEHPLSLGVFGFAGHRDAREALLGTDVDCLLSVGASLNETSTYNWNPALRAGKCFIQVDIDPDRIGRNYPIEVGVVGDAQAVLAELVLALRRRIGSHGRRSTWAGAPALSRGHARHTSVDERTSTAVPVTPQRWRCDLQEALPAEATIFSDIGGHMLFNLHELCLGGGQRFVVNMGFGSMGHGTAAPIGAALAFPGRPVISIIGDGCFTMNGMELLTAREYELPVIWIVEHNQMHGITWHGSRLVGSKRPMAATRYRHGIDVGAIASAMGLAVWRVSAPGQMQPALREALQARTPAVIEVQVDASIPPPLGDRARSIAGFIESQE